MQVQKNDFVELNYVGRFKDNNQIFDLTDEKTAKENKFNPKLVFKPVIICVGNHDIVNGLDDELVGKEVGKKYTVGLVMDKGFGRKDPKLIRLVPARVFIKEKINPVPGLQVTLGESLGVIISSSGGRVLVDFNHPYAGHDLIYEFEIKRKVTDLSEKLKSFFELHFNSKNMDIKVEGGVASIPLEVPEQLAKPLSDRLKEIIPELTSVEFKKHEEHKHEHVKQDNFNKVKEQ